MKYLDFLSRVQIGSCRFERERNGNSVHLLKRANTADSFPLRFIEIGRSFRSITMRHAGIELSPPRRRYLSRWLGLPRPRPSFDPRRSDWKVITRPIPRKDTFEIDFKTISWWIHLRLPTPGDVHPKRRRFEPWFNHSCYSIKIDLHDCTREIRGLGGLGVDKLKD